MVALPLSRIADPGWWAGRPTDRTASMLRAVVVRRSSCFIRGEAAAQAYATGHEPRRHPPPYSPELSPVERLWEHLRGRWLSHPALACGYEALVDAACAAWNARCGCSGRSSCWAAAWA